jgi:hypothetical protein
VSGENRKRIKLEAHLLKARSQIEKVKKFIIKKKKEKKAIMKNVVVPSATMIDSSSLSNFHDYSKELESTRIRKKASIL